MISQRVFDTSEVLRQLGLRQIVICPGSRNAPLTVSFARNEGIECFSAIDERSAAFMAMGMSLATGLPTAVCCTSGTALLNFGPAAAEAYYQEIPLIIISADRPPEWINQRDGQTIQQYKALEPHVKASFQLPVDLTHEDAQWEYKRKLREAMEEAQRHPRGPVHLNIPFREPFYPAEDQSLAFSEDPQLVASSPQAPTEDVERLQPLLERWRRAKKKIIVLGQGTLSAASQRLLSQLSVESSVPVVADVTGNGHEIAQVITTQDLFLSNRDSWDTLRPNLILTIGQSLISKQLKMLLRTGVPHWHLSQGERPSDTFQSLVGTLRWPLEKALGQLAQNTPGDAAYFESWQSSQESAKRVLSSLSDEPFSDYTAYQAAMKVLPTACVVHLANSMAVRYANFFHHEVAQGIVFQGNRGTSGIDGSNSTAVGYAINSKQQNFLMTGDISLLYDRNAFLNDHVSDNLKIIVINNFGGKIFDLIPGPRRLTDLERNTFLGTSHHRSMASLAASEGFSYWVATDSDTTQTGIRQLIGSPTKGLLEIQTNPSQSQMVYDRIRHQMQSGGQ